MLNTKKGWMEFQKNGEKWEITLEQKHNGKTYAAILKLLEEGQEIASYPLLQMLRNEKSQEYFKKFYVFVPNPDKRSETKRYVSRFVADFHSVGLSCGWPPSFSNPALGVFLIRRGC